MTSALRGVDAALVQVAVAPTLDGVPAAVLADDGGSGAPGYQLATVDADEQMSAPNDLAAYLPAGTACEIRRGPRPDLGRRH